MENKYTAVVKKDADWWIGWVKAQRVTEPDQIGPVVKTALESRNPWLIDVLVE